MKTQIKGFVPTPVEIETLAMGDFFSYGRDQESFVYICVAPPQGLNGLVSIFKVNGTYIQVANRGALVYKLVPPDEIKFALA